MTANLLLHIDEPVEGNELAGEPVGGFERTGRKAWFESRTLSGREYQQAQQMQSSVTHELRCVYFAGANSRMRLSKGDDIENPTRVFHVESVVNENEANRFLVWMVQEVV